MRYVVVVVGGGSLLFVNGFCWCCCLCMVFVGVVCVFFNCCYFVVLPLFCIRLSQ